MDSVSSQGGRGYTHSTGNKTRRGQTNSFPKPQAVRSLFSKLKYGNHYEMNMSSLSQIDGVENIRQVTLSRGVYHLAVTQMC